YDAGDYVCNYSMYVILDHLKRRRLLSRFGFIHIPHDYNPARARRFILSVARKIQAKGRPLSLSGTWTEQRAGRARGERE
ncbi:hypothetical protein EPO44_05600, partial [bacterium]